MKTIAKGVMETISKGGNAKGVVKTIIKGRGNENDNKWGNEN